MTTPQPILDLKTLNEYGDLALKTASRSNNPNDQLIIATLGLAGEAGEVAEHIKKWLAQGHTLDGEILIHELGDILWYINLASESLGVTLRHVAQANLIKLADRYPDGFSTEASINRDPS